MSFIVKEIPFARPIMVSGTIVVITVSKTFPRQCQKMDEFAKIFKAPRQTILRMSAESVMEKLRVFE